LRRVKEGILEGIILDGTQKVATIKDGSITPVEIRFTKEYVPLPKVFNKNPINYVGKRKGFDYEGDWSFICARAKAQCTGKFEMEIAHLPLRELLPFSV